MQILEGYAEFESFAYIARRYNSAAEATSLLSSVASLAIIMQSFLFNLIESEYLKKHFHIALFLPHYSTAKFVTERVIISLNVLANGTIIMPFF